MVNRCSPYHVDINGKVEWFDQLLTVGQYEGLDMVFPQQQLQLCYEAVTVRGCGLVLSIVHLPPLTVDSPFTFTVLLIFFADTFRYVVW